MSTNLEVLQAGVAVALAGLTIAEHLRTAADTLGLPELADHADHITTQVEHLTATISAHA